MKPNKLILKNIGPFLGMIEIDFSQLGDIFLICGKTGSGKTTIFDSMTYALYGKIAGARSTMTRMMRSHFVSQTEESYVIFEFILKGERYKIQRILPVLYESRSGSKREKPEETILSCHKNEWQIIGTKTSEVNARIVEMIGLLSEEFSRIVLLPQGEFAEFLQQNSNDRKEALAKLFPIELYQKITERVKNSADVYMQQVKEKEHFIQDLAREFKIDDFADAAARLEAQIIQSKEKQIKIQDAIYINTKKLESAIEIHTKLQNKIKWQTELHNQLEKQNYIEKAKTQLEKAHNADTCVFLLRSKKQYKKNIEEADIQLTESTEKYIYAQNELQKLESDENEFERRIRVNTELKIKQSDLEHSLTIEKQLYTVEKNLTEKKQMKAQLEYDIQEEKEKIQPLNIHLQEADILITQIQARTDIDMHMSENLENAKKMKDNAEHKEKILISTDDALNAEKSIANEISECERKVSSARNLLDILEQEKRESEKNMHAFVLSAQLQPNFPCPVCGSLSHPRPADAKTEGYTIQVNDEKIAKQKISFESAEKELQSKIGMQSVCKTRLDILQKELAQFDATIPNLLTAKEMLAQAAANKEKSKSAVDESHRALTKKQQAEQEKNKYEARIVKMQQTYSAVQSETASLLAEKKELEKQIVQTDNISIQEALQNITDTIEKNAAYIESYREQKQVYAEHIAEESGKKNELEKSIISYRREYETIQDDLRNKMSELRFLFEEEIEESFLEQQEQTELKKNITQWTERCTELKTLLLQVEKDLEGKKIEDSTRLEIEKSQLLQEQITETQIYSRTISESDVLNEKKKRWEQLENERQKIAAESKVCIELANDLSGNNIKKRSFEAWMLGLYLEEITVYASRRLEKISDGRYTLLLNTEKTTGKQRYSGLDLEIFDSYTGKTRPCQTLSGGETFMASISLALGLSDAVQNRSGGIQLDSLFIDEGFGSLDEASLEKALSILDEIRGTRIIGLISHVGELKNRIPSRLNIHKTIAGSTVEIHTT